jgi:hypothetical protein
VKNDYRGPLQTVLFRGSLTHKILYAIYPKLVKEINYGKNFEEMLTK